MRALRGWAAPAALLASALCPCAARAADIDTSLGGFVKFQYGIFDSNMPQPANGARIDGEAHLAVDGQTDTGVTYGGRLQLVRAAKARDNGTFLQAGWAWGEIRLGDYGGAAKELSVSAPNVGVGQIDGDLDRFGAPSALIAPYALNNDDSTKIMYLSPSIVGLRLGLSYTPELTGGGIEPVPAPHIDGINRHRNVTEIALASSRDIGATTVTMGGAYVFGEATDASHLHDLSGGSIGIKAVWNGLTVGGGFIYDGATTLPVDRRPGHVDLESVISEINLGVTYDIGKWGFGLSWAHDYRKALPSTDIVALGAVYRIVRGLTLAADLAHYTRPEGSSQQRETTALLMETAVHF
jgi:hypothetical protein